MKLVTILLLTVSATIAADAPKPLSNEDKILVYKANSAYLNAELAKKNAEEDVPKKLQALQVTVNNLFNTYKVDRSKYTIDNDLNWIAIEQPKPVEPPKPEAKK